MEPTTTDSTPHADGAKPELALADGSADSTRKVMVALCTLCIAIFSACVIAIGFYVHLVAGLAVTATVAMWIGWSIAQTLKETKDSSPNGRDEGRAGNA